MAFRAVLSLALFCVALFACQPRIEELRNVPYTNAGLRITVLFDSHATHDTLQTGWGFAALVQSPEAQVLFDTGADGTALLANMERLGVVPSEIDVVVLSHAHGDHTGGVIALLQTGATPTVYLLSTFPEPFVEKLRTMTTVISITRPGQRVASRMFSTGHMGGEIPEHGLVVETTQGAVLLTGCAHPGIVSMVERTLELVGEAPLHLVMGGFHLTWSEPHEHHAVAEAFERLGVEQVVPTHCTGDEASAHFDVVFDSRSWRVPVGERVELE